MSPILIGYFAHRPWTRAEDRRLFPAQIEAMCNVGNAIAPPDWINLWLHNDYWVFSTEARAWAAAVDNANLHRLRADLPRRRDGKPGSIEAGMDDYIARHVPVPDAAAPSAGRRFEWWLFAYRMFPLRFADGVEAPYPIRAEGVQPLPADYDYLGLDVVSRERDLEFCHSPLDCNGWYTKVAVNRFCLLDELETALQLARHWSNGKFDEKGSYVGPAEPGPYFIVEVFRKRFETA